MIKRANDNFLNARKDFPGPNFIKFSFVIIGLLCWVEFFYPNFKFASHYLGILFESENLILGVISFSSIFGVLACAFLWFPTYIFSIIQAISRKPK